MPESGTSGSAGGALGRSMVISTRARKWKRRIQPREHLQAAHQRPIPTTESVQTPRRKTPDLVGVAVGSFADPSFPRPEQSVWTKDKHAWLPADHSHTVLGRDHPTVHRVRSRPSR